MADTNKDFKKHIEDYKAEALLKANKKAKRLSIDLKMMDEKMKELKGENDELKKELRQYKEYLGKARKKNKITAPMTTEDYMLWLDGVSLSKTDHINGLKKQLLDLTKRRDKLLSMTNKHYAEKRLAINAFAINSVLDDIKAYECGEGLIKYPYK